MANVFDQFDAPDSGNVFDQFDAPKTNTALDIAKGVGVGLASLPDIAFGAVPRITGALGGLAEKIGLGTPNPQAEELRKTIEGNTLTLGGIPNLLPQPEGGLGRAAQTVTEFAVPGAALRGNIARNVGVGAAAGLGSEVAGQATEGTSAELPARVVGALAGGYAGTRGMEAAANRIGRAVTPSGAQLEAEFEGLYKDAKQEATATKVGAGVLDETAAKTRATINAADPTFREVASPEVHGILNKIGTGASNDVGDLVAARKALRDVKGGETAAAREALKVIDGKIEELAPGVMRKIREADQNFRAFKTDEELGKKFIKAEMQAAGEHSGLNYGNKVRQKAEQLANSTKAERFYTPESIKALKELNKGTLTQNSLRYVSNLLGGGGGIGQTLIAGGVGYHEGGIHGGLGAIAAGRLTRGMYNRLVANQAQKTAAMVRAQSPLAQRMALERSSPLLPTYSSPGQFYNNPNYSRLASLLPTGPQFRQGAAQTGLLATILASPGARSLLGQ